jgi:hypothetical protein
LGLWSSALKRRSKFNEKTEWRSRWPRKIPDRFLRKCEDVNDRDPDPNLNPNPKQRNKNKKIKIEKKKVDEEIAAKMAKLEAVQSKYTAFLRVT